MTLVAQGKVRDLFDAGEDRLLLVATDRISAFDVILPTPIPDKGRVLTACSLFWFERLRVRAEPPDQRGTSDVPAAVRRGRGAGGPGDTRARGRRDPDGVRGPRLPRRVRLDAVPGAWAVCGVRLPLGLQESAKLPEPIFTPTTKAAEGHDLPLTPAEAARPRRRRVCTSASARRASRCTSGSPSGPRRRRDRGRHEVRVRLRPGDAASSP